MEIKSFCMKVKPEQSIIIQEFLFANGYCWAGGDTKVLCTEYNYLILKKYNKEKPHIVWSNVYKSNNEYPLITFEQFKNLYMKSTELKITSDKVLSAATKCSQAKAVLQELFPEVFENDKYLDLSNDELYSDMGLLAVRSEAEYAEKSIWLNNCYNWELVRDSMNKLCLIPTKKY